MSFDQGQFNFDAPGSDAGWRKWRQELEAQQRAFESRWGVVLGKRVTVFLYKHAKPVSGLLEWVNRNEVRQSTPPRFRIRSLEFGYEEIESIVQEDGHASE